jgi:hypothetical protein
MRARFHVPVSALIAVLFVVAACSSPAGTSAPGSSDPGPATPTDAAGSAPATAAASPEIAASDAPTGDGEAQAIVVIGDQTYVFLPGPYGLCSDRGDGSISVGGTTKDFDPGVSGAGASFVIQADGWQDPNPDLANEGDPYIKIGDYGTGQDWNAGAGPFLGKVTYDDSHIESSTLGGGHAEGTAMFIEQGQAFGQEEPVSIAGTFEVTCG